VPARTALIPASRMRAISRRAASVELP
jgi:hypothetical protein